MAPSNPSMLASSPAGAAGSPPSATTTSVTAAEMRGNYTLITSRPSSNGPGRSGRWTPDERLLFLHGLKLHGRGRWKKIRQFLPTRTLIQIKSHAQKVLKREELGDDVFLPLKANKDKVDALLKDKSRLFQRDDPAASTLMSSDGRYHTIAMQEATTGNHGPHQQQQQRLLQTPLPPGYHSPYYKTAAGSSGHPMPPFAFPASGTNHPPDPMHHLHQEPASALPRYHHPHSHHNHHQQSPMMHHHHQQHQLQQHHYRHNHHPPQHGSAHHMSSPQQSAPQPHLPPPPPPQIAQASSQPGAPPALGIVPDLASTAQNLPTELPQTQVLQTPQGASSSSSKRKATTDVLAAAALCELFRGEGKELEQSNNVMQYTPFSSLSDSLPEKFCSAIKHLRAICSVQELE